MHVFNFVPVCFLYQWSSSDPGTGAKVSPFSSAVVGPSPVCQCLHIQYVRTCVRIVCFGGENASDAFVCMSLCVYVCRRNLCVDCDVV